MNKPLKPSKPKPVISGGIKILFAILMVWGLLIAVGSFQTQASTDFRRSLVVGITMTAFLGIWALALRNRNRNQL